LTIVASLAAILAPLAAEVLRVKPDFSADAYVARLPYREADDRAHHTARASARQAFRSDVRISGFGTELTSTSQPHKVCLRL
jgi:hypothetical protein